MIKIEIKNRFSGTIIFEYQKENNTIKDTVLEYLKQSEANLIGADLIRANLIGANLSGANLSGADLSGANLSEANLSGADLIRANLSGADLIRANLIGANLSGANLSEANLSGADLIRADLSGANLSEANLSGADLSEANLSGANLSEANLSEADLSGANLISIKADFYLVLLDSINEIPGLRKSLVEGKVNGSSYEGECACLVGTIANVKGCNYKSITNIIPNSSRPSERFFLGINIGDTPETNQISKIVVEWIDEFTSKININSKQPT